ncbi:MAG TPA: hypothetical protein VJL87_06630, partial [Bdellovibrionota bacterium]|nr:hypothetical protein [Bdellovibrionota bacterium]
VKAALAIMESIPKSETSALDTAGGVKKRSKMIGRNMPLRWVQEGAALQGGGIIFIGLNFPAL